MGEFTDAIRARLPEDEPGTAVVNRLIDVYVQRDNKRNIVIVIQVTPTERLRIMYTMPVPAAGAKLFKKEGLQPPGDLAISTVAGDYTPSANFPTLNSEIIRIEAVASTDTPHRKTMQNLLVYWRYMRDQVYAAIESADVQVGESVTRRSERSNRASDPIGHRTPR